MIAHAVGSTRRSLISIVNLPVRRGKKCIESVLSCDETRRRQEDFDCCRIAFRSIGTAFRRFSQAHRLSRSRIHAAIPNILLHVYKCISKRHVCRVTYRHLRLCVKAKRGPFASSILAPRSRCWNLSMESTSRDDFLEILSRNQKFRPLGADQI